MTTTAQYTEAIARSLAEGRATWKSVVAAVKREPAVAPVRISSLLRCLGHQPARVEVLLEWLAPGVARQRLTLGWLADGYGAEPIVARLVRSGDRLLRVPELPHRHWPYPEAAEVGW